MDFAAIYAEKFLSKNTEYVPPESQPSRTEEIELRPESLGQVEKTILAAYHLHKSQKLESYKKREESKHSRWADYRAAALLPTQMRDSSLHKQPQPIALPVESDALQAVSSRGSSIDRIPDQPPFAAEMTYHMKEPLPMAPIYLPPPPANTIDRPLDHPNHIDEKIDLDTEPYGDTSPAARPSSAVSRKKAFVPVSVYNERAKSPVYRLSGPTDSTLLFESHFESGNLSKATKIEEFTYELTVRRDYETAGHTQWFYFRIDNVVSGIDYTFKICNLMKPKSLYGDGMRPLLYSNHLASLEGLGWTRAGFRISYSVNPEKDELTKMPLHTLTFSMRFPQTRDTVYIAHCYPYTYTHLQNYIQLLKRNPLLENIFRHKVLGKTPGGNNLDMLCISTKVESPAELAKRRAVVLIGRVHPGETNSSFFMHGFIEFITGDSKEAQFLRDHYVVKLIPMLNPDGVIVGNYRCNLKGFDLNRQWKMPPGHEANAPEVHMVKAMIERTLAAREIAFFCDMHGHSRKHGVFLYGCNNKDSPVHENKERIFPYLLSRRNPHFFVFERCHYRLQAKKQGTARIVMRNEFRIINSFTVETSFCGSDSLQVHFNQRHLRSMGADFALTLHAYLHQYPSIETTAIDWNAICSQPGAGTSAIADELFVSSER
ncbi:Cytosolic carboxypeptidase 2 [Kappamyces sp. JEL0680]|nr:Cytosolic carboxypeptidase 2 [Kappamyces sp. JEL0680]